MNINIEKIANGYLVTFDRGPNETDPLNQYGHKRVFADVPEAICGIMSEWVLEECRRLGEAKEDGVKKVERIMYQPRRLDLSY